MFDGKIAIVSGGTRGIGRAIVMELAKNGANIAFNYLNSKESADKLCEEIGLLGCKCSAYQVNISDYKKVKDMVNDVEENLGPVDIVVNNAALLVDRALALMSVEDWHNVINTNLNGTFNLTKSVIASMMKRRSGIIVNITSKSGVHGNARQTNYSAAKAGVIGFTRALAKEVASYGIRVNAIAPGFIDTDMVKHLPDYVNKIPMKRAGTTEEVAKLVNFICSDHSSYITGDVIGIDGGLMS